MNKGETNVCEIILLSRLLVGLYRCRHGGYSTGFDKTAYMKEYMRKRRAAAKAAKT